MNTVYRKVTYRLYPNTPQEIALLAQKQAHQRLYNAALEQRRTAWRRCRTSLSYVEQCKDLTALRQADPDSVPINAQAAPVTLKRLDLAFQHFFRRVKQEQTPGFPRFKSLKRFKGWGYKAYGDGWSLDTRPQMRHGAIRLAGIGKVRIRGGARTPGTPKTCDILHKHGKWYACVTITCVPARAHGHAVVALDWGVESCATIAVMDGDVTTVTNPRWLHNSLHALATAQRDASRKHRHSRNWHKAQAQVTQHHTKIARQRRDFLHKTSAALVQQAHVLISEQLNIQRMTRRPSPQQDESGRYIANGAKAKAGLNREILSTAPGMFFDMLRTKAAEATAVYIEVPTKQVKPSQTCHQCGRQDKKSLSQRQHRCPCGATCSRDANAALVALQWGIQHFLAIFFAWMGAYHPASGTVRAVERSLNGSSAKQGFPLRSVRVDVERFKQEHRT
jgi:putative transposase